MEDKKVVHLALQGGGAHGAFTWGILDKIIEDGRLDIDGICATSAGSMNAIVYAYGKMTDGVEGARKHLEKFWFKVSQAGMLSSTSDNLIFSSLMKKMQYTAFQSASYTLSPYQFNPTNYNVLRDILEECVDFRKLNLCNCSNLFISATNVRTGKVRIFNNAEVSIDVAMASACMPNVFHAVKVGDHHYWDGGYSGNPAIFPLFYHGTTKDVVIAHINPIIRSKLPTDADEIMNRINEITFNASLLKELRAVAFVNRLVEEDWIKDEHKHKLNKILVHSIRADQALLNFEVSTKFNTNWDFLLSLKNLGRLEAHKWLKKNFDLIGKESSVDIEQEFLTSNDEPVDFRQN